MPNVSASNDTIFARASGAGRAGIAVYRLSGPESHRIAKDLVGKRIKVRAPVLAVVKDPATGETIDRGLAILFKSPASYTGEDVAEFHLHGSAAVEAAFFGALARLGARPAEAGEFTLRAMKNGKLDLAQAEALADLIDAETTLQRKQALGQLDGRLSAVAERWRTRLLAVMAPLEAAVDFPDEADVPAAVAARAGPAIAALKTELTAYLADSGRARRIREGVLIAVIGPPNAGKSSLVNALAGSEVAIVSETPGTTRDIVETRLDLSGVVATIADTAGLRIRTNDQIEEEGVRRARARAEAADIRVLVLDPGENVSRETFGTRDSRFGIREEKRAGSRIPNGFDLLRPGDVLVWSKADLGAAIPQIAAPEGVAVMAVSSKTREGMDALLAALAENVSRETLPETPALTRARHVKAVEDALAALSRAEGKIETAPELAAEDARLAARALGSITGAVGVEDVLGEIFSSFCIGK